MNPGQLVTPPPPVHLNRYHHFTRLMRETHLECTLRRFVSEHDGTQQSLLSLHPRATPATTNFLFLHGMDGDCGDAVVVSDLASRGGGVVHALGGRGPAWVSDAFLADARQIMRTHCGGPSGFYLIGISMGGTQALTLAALEPPHSCRLLGVVAFIPGADLLNAAQHSSNLRVKASLMACVANDLEKLKERSPLALAACFPPGVPVAIVYNERDTVLPVEDVKRLIDRLDRLRIPVTCYTLPGDHSFVVEGADERIDYPALLAALGHHAPMPHPVPMREMLEPRAT